MQHTCGTGRPADCVVDVSLDEFAGSRDSAVAGLIPLVIAAWQDNMLATMGNFCTFIGCRYLDLDSISGTGGFHAPVGGHPTTGGVTDQGSTPSTAWLIHKTCAHTRAQKAGRMYVPGPTEGNVNTDGTIASAMLSTVNTKVGAFLNAVGAGTFYPPATTAWRVVHVTGHTGTAVPGYPNGYPNSWNSTDVNSVSCDTRVATQRRRLRK